MTLLSKVGKFLDSVTNSASTIYFIKQITAKYGELKDFEIDKEKRKIISSFLLKGEAEPVKIIIDKYEINRNKSNLQFTVLDAHTDREWLNTLLQNIVNLNIL